MGLAPTEVGLIFHEGGWYLAVGSREVLTGELTPHAKAAVALFAALQDKAAWPVISAALAVVAANGTAEKILERLLEPAQEDGDGNG